MKRRVGSSRFGRNMILTCERLVVDASIAEAEFVRSVDDGISFSDTLALSELFAEYAFTAARGMNELARHGIFVAVPETKAFHVKHRRLT